MKVLVLVFITLFSISAAAGESNSKISLIQVNVATSVKDIAVLTMAQNPEGSPNCGSDDVRFVLDLTSDGGKAALSTLLAAQAQDKTVYVKGTNTCTLVSYLENLSYIRVE